MATNGPDGYTVFTQADQEWFYAELRRLAGPHPEDVQSFARRKAGLDLEIFFAVAPRSRARFTTDVCLELQRRVAERTGVIAPVIYVHGDPHPQAHEALVYAEGR